MTNEAPQAPEAVKVFFEGANLKAPKPKVTLLSWVSYYAYNIARKPKVWRLKREQEQIYKRVYDALREEVFPDLYRVRLVCSTCRNAYGTLKGQVFISMIHMILKNSRCDEHPESYDKFLFIYKPLFDRNEELAAEINGFRR